MVGIYLSGTGNTKYCIEKLVSLIHSSAKAIPMESPEAISAIQQNEEIYIGYPTQFSNAPYMVRDFIKKNADIWKNKKILCIATMGAFRCGLHDKNVKKIRGNYFGWNTYSYARLCL